jgi:hypothetical protein
VGNHIADGVNGRICDMNSDALANAVYELYNDAVLREKFIQANMDYSGGTDKDELLEVFSL